MDPKEDPKPSSEAATQSGSLGGGSVLVDAAALVKLVGAHVDAAPSAAVIAERAAALGDGKVAEIANTLSVETAAMRAALMPSPTQRARVSRPPSWSPARRRL